MYQNIDFSTWAPDFTLYIFIYFEEGNIDNDNDGTMTILRIS